MKLLQGPQWETLRPQVCRALSRSEAPEPELQALAHQLDTTYHRTAANFPTNAAVRVEQVDGRDTLTLTGLEVRFSLGLPESLFTVVEGRDADGAGVFTFYGRGWGHGVGLCQNGAFGMALAGHDSLEILE